MKHCGVCGFLFWGTLGEACPECNYTVPKRARLPRWVIGWLWVVLFAVLFFCAFFLLEAATYLLGGKSWLSGIRIN